MIVAVFLLACVVVGAFVAVAMFGFAALAKRGTQDHETITLVLDTVRTQLNDVLGQWAEERKHLFYAWETERQFLVHAVVARAAGELSALERTAALPEMQADRLAMMFDRPAGRYRGEGDGVLRDPETGEAMVPVGLGG